MIESNKPIFQSTLGDLREVLREFIPEQAPLSPPPKGEKKNYVYGMKGLANLLGCSLPTASRIKKEGVLQSATYQFNRHLVFDADEVMELLRLDNQRRQLASKRRRTSISF